VKLEPHNNDDMFGSDEEMSEGEELRRAAKAYAAVAKRPNPEVIVLDSSSDEEEQRAAKRRAVPPGRPAYQSQSRQLHQQVDITPPPPIPPTTARFKCLGMTIVKPLRTEQQSKAKWRPHAHSRLAISPTLVSNSPPPTPQLCDMRLRSYGT